MCSIKEPVAIDCGVICCSFVLSGPSRLGGTAQPSLAEGSAANAAITRRWTGFFAPNELINMKTSPTMKKTLVLIAAGALFAADVYAFPDYEGFNYTVGNNLTNCGKWYVAGTSSAAQLTIASDSLSYNGLATSQGNKVIFGGTGESARVALSTQIGRASC